MKHHIVSAKEFRKNIFQALDDIADNLTPYILTKNGEPKAIVMSLVELESLMETYDILQDPELMRQIRAHRHGKKRKYIDWEDLKRELK